MLKNFPPNSAGSDFICSDIHGHFSLLEAELSHINFNESRDRLFCLGDLIDRGDESPLALEWLKESWFYAIQGNHERMLINAYEQRSEMLWRQWMMWGGSWAEDMDFDELEPIYDRWVNDTRGLLEMKNHDYGEAWRDMRISSMTDIILMKLHRVKQIEDNEGKTLVSEGVEANYQDIINYAVFCLIKLTEQKNV